MGEFSRTATAGLTQPESWTIEIPVKGRGEQHLGILKNFVEAILDKKSLIAPAGEGIHSVELANAMLMSAFLDKTIELPLDAAAYEALLQENVATSNAGDEVVIKPDGVGELHYVYDLAPARVENFSKFILP